MDFPKSTRRLWKLPPCRTVWRKTVCRSGTPTYISQYICYCPKYDAISDCIRSECIHSIIRRKYCPPNAELNSKTINGNISLRSKDRPNANILSDNLSNTLLYDVLVDVTKASPKANAPDDSVCSARTLQKESHEQNLNDTNIKAGSRVNRITNISVSNDDIITSKSRDSSGPATSIQRDKENKGNDRKNDTGATKSLSRKRSRNRDSSGCDTCKQKNHEHKRKDRKNDTEAMKSLPKKKSSSDIATGESAENDQVESEKRDDYFDKQYVPDEFEHDPYAFDLYRKAISEGEETDTTVRVNVVGTFAQGKTSLTKRLLKQGTKDIQSTNSVEINHCTYEHIQNRVIFHTKVPDENGNEIVDRIVSVAQSEKEKESQALAKDSDFIQSNSDVSRERPPSLLSHQSTEVDFGKTNMSANVSSPRSETEMSTAMHDSAPENFANGGLTHSSNMQKKQNGSGVSTLSRNEQKKFSKLIKNNRHRNSHGRDLEIWDFGGQFIFYATHTLFHSRRAVYLLVFDLSKQLSATVSDFEYPEENVEKDMGQYAKFWMNSIHTYVGSDDGSEPPVILVGTHKDKLKGDERAKQQLKDDYFEKVRKLFENSVMINHIQPVDYAIDNTDLDDTGIEELRLEIVRHGAKYAKPTKIPARWIALEIRLKQIRSKKIITFKEVMIVDSENEFPLKEQEQVKLFLLYHHAKGTLFYFDEDPISEYVVLDTQYLIDAFKCIITSGRFCKKDPPIRRLWNILTREAKLENELIEKLWALDTNNDFLKHKRELLMFLQKHHILSEALEYDEHSQISHGLGWYVVPSLLRDHCTEDTLKYFITGKPQTSVRFVMSFGNSPLVQVVYRKLLAALIGRWAVVEMTSSERKSLLYENLGVFRLDEFHAGIVEIKQSKIDLRVLNLCPSSSVDHEIADKFRRFSESIVKNEFRKLRHSSVQQRQLYTTCFRCNNKEHGLNGSTHEVLIESIEDKKLVPCPDMMSHEIYPEQAMAEWFHKDKGVELISDCQINEKQLSKIAQSVGQNWELLGIELGLNNAKIQQISLDNKTSEMEIYMMLIKWKEMKGKMATINALVQAMKTTKKVHIEWDAIRNIVEEVKCKQQI